MISSTRNRRFITFAAVVALAVGSAPAAHAGDQAIVDKGIGFLDGIRTQSMKSPCSSLVKEFKARKISLDNEADFDAGVERDAQSRRDWIDKQSGGMTQDQKDQLEAAIERTREWPKKGAIRCHIAKWDPSYRAPAGAKSGSTDSGESTDSHASSRPEAATPRPATDQGTAAPKKDEGPNLLQQVEKLQKLNADGQDSTAAQQQPAPAAGFTQLLIPNPFDAAHPFVVGIPPFVPQNFLAGLALPAGWVLR